MVYLYKEDQPDPLEDGTHLGELVSEVPEDEELIEYVSGMNSNVNIFYALIK